MGNRKGEIVFDYYGHNVDIVAMWVPSLYCKTGCYYCYNTEGQRNNLGSTFDMENIEKYIKFFNSHGTFSILVTGGEPFDFPNIYYLLKELSKKHHLVMQTSLRHNINEFMESVPPEKSMFMRCSLHPYVMMNFDNYFNKVRILKEKGYHPIVCLPGFPNTFSSIPKWYRKFESINVAFEVTFASVNGAFYPYKEKELQFLRNWMLNPVVVRQLYGQLGFAGKLCYTGWKDIYIPADGLVHRCANHNVVIGNIMTNELNLTTKEIPCSCSLCGCRNYLYDEVVVKDGSRKYMQALIDGFVPCMGNDKMEWVE